MNKLDKWLKDQGIAGAAFARQHGWTRWQIHRWRRGDTRPEIDDAFKLERVTGGAVPAEWWTEVAA